METPQSRYLHSKYGLLGRIHTDQMGICKKKQRPQPTYTKDELRAWALIQDLFHILYEEWAINGFMSEDRPSCDRIDDTKSYSLDNIQLMAWKDNLAKSRADIKSGKLKQRQKAVSQYTLNGEFVAIYHAIMEATRMTGVNRTTITWVCNGVRKTAGGYLWRWL